MQKSELQPIRSAKTGHEQVVSKKAFEENKANYAPYVAITWEEMKTFELIEKTENVKKENIKSKIDEIKKDNKSVKQS